MLELKEMTKSKKQLVIRILVAFFIWLCLILVAIAAMFSSSIINLIFQSPLLGIADCGVSAGVWLDQNGNGVKENIEQPFAGACLWVNAQNPKTDLNLYDVPVCIEKEDFSDEDGKWFSGFFSCSHDVVYVSVRPPDGFRSTTVPVIESKGQSIQFGIASQSTNARVEIESLEYYSDYYRHMRETKVVRNRYVLVVSILVSAIVSWVVSKKLVKSH